MSFIINSEGKLEQLAEEIDNKEYDLKTFFITNPVDVKKLKIYFDKAFSESLDFEVGLLFKQLEKLLGFDKELDKEKIISLFDKSRQELYEYYLNKRSNYV